MMTESPSVKNWVRSFCRACDASIGYIDCESEPVIILYHNGKDTEEHRSPHRDEVEEASITPDWEVLYALSDP